MSELSVKEYARRTGITPQAVYLKIENKQLKFVEKMSNNRLVKYVVVDDVEFIDSSTLTSEEQNKPLQTSIVENDRLLDFLENMQEKMNNYAELAGQAKLLTDSEHRTKEQYFEVVQEKAQLQAKNETLQAKIEELQEKLKSQEVNKSSSWWRKL